MGETSPYILNVSFIGVENGALALMLSNRGVMVSTGAACTTGDNAPSHVLMAMYGDEARARSAIRISFSHDTTEDEVRIAASEIVECVEMLRGMM
jgi:cysteine desulfurase